MSWETLYNFVAYNQTMIHNAKRLQEWTSCVITHTIWQEKKFRFSTYILLKYHTQACYKRDVQMVSIHLNNHNIEYVKHNVLNGTKLIDINIFS